MGEKTYRYDAFISYRHDPLSYAAAHRLQRLLEGYAAPRGTPCGHTTRIRRFFVDDTEMPNNPDLTRSIQEGLENARYLIVICCEALLESKWCHEEVRYFKELNGNSAARIVPVLIQGDPRHEEGKPSKVFFPEMLETEETHLDERGQEVPVKRPIEPLYTDVRAKSARAVLRRLGAEKLRVAAPLLGCGYDALYRRHRRRKIRRTAAALAATALVGTGVGIALARLDASRREASAALKYQMASQAVQAGNPAMGMRLYADALTLRPSQTLPERVALSLLLQQHAWTMPLPAREGTILGGTLLLPAAQAEDAPANALLYEGVRAADLLAVDAQAGVLLAQSGAVYEIRTLQGEVLDRLDASEGVFAGPREALGGFVFSRQEGTRTAHTVYELATGARRTIWTEAAALVLAYDGGRAALAVHADRLAFYAPAEEGFALAQEMAVGELIASYDPLVGRWFALQRAAIDPAGKLLAVSDGWRTTVIHLGTKKVLLQDGQRDYAVSDIAFSRGQSVARYVAVSYGIPPSADIAAGGGVQVFDLYHKEPLLDTRSSSEEALEAVRFGEGTEGCLVGMTYGKKARLYGPTGAGYALLAQANGADGALTGAISGGLGLFTLATQDGLVRGYAALTGSSAKVADLQDPRKPILAIVPEGDSLSLLTYASLVRVDAATGERISSVGRGPEYQAFLAEHPLALWEEELLYEEEAVERAPGWVWAAALEQIIKGLDMTRFEATQAGVLFKDWVLDGTGRQLYAIGSVLPYLAKLELDPDRRQATLASLHPLPSGAAPASLWLSAEGKRLAVAMADGDVLVYDTENLEAPVAAIASAAVGGIEAMAFDDTLTYLAAGALDEKTQTGSLLLWHIRTQTLLAARSYEGFWVDAVRFSGDTLYYGKDDTLYRLSLAAPETDAARLAFFSALSGYEENEWSLLKPVPVPDADTLLTVRDGWSGLYALVTDWKEVAKE